MQSRYFLTQGRCYAAAYVSGTSTSNVPLRPLGNATALDLALGRAALRDTTSNEVRPDLMRDTGEQPQVTLTLESFDKHNLALLLFGSARQVAAVGTITETVAVARGMLTPLRAIMLDEDIIVRSSNGGTTYTAGVDYIAHSATGSIEIPANSRIASANVQVTYAGNSYDSIGAFTANSPDLRIRFEGVNQADNNSPVVAELYRVKLDPVDAMSLIGDNLSSLKLSGKLLPDFARPLGGADGRYLRILQAP